LDWISAYVLCLSRLVVGVGGSHPSIHSFLSSPPHRKVKFILFFYCYFFNKNLHYLIFPPMRVIYAVHYCIICSVCGHILFHSPQHPSTWAVLLIYSDFLTLFCIKLKDGKMEMVGEITNMVHYWKPKWETAHWRGTLIIYMKNKKIKKKF